MHFLKKSPTVLKTLFILAITLGAFSASAQEADTKVRRDGFVIGFGVGVGAGSISESNQEVPFDEGQFVFTLPNLKLGWMVNERLAILGTFHGMIYDFDGKDRSFEAFTPSVQYWVKDHFWINGGVGLSVDMPALYEFDDLSSEDWNFGCAVSASAGYEFYQNDNYTIDLHTKLYLGRVFLDNDQYRDGVALSVGVGFNWY